MDWTATVQLDADKSNVGHVMATFTDLDESTFRHSGRSAVTLAGRDAFVAEAIAARDAWRVKKAAEATLSVHVTERFAELDT